MQIDRKTLDDLVVFAAIELRSGDIEPWATVLRQMHVRHLLDQEQAAWAVKLYNAYDDLCSAFTVFDRHTNAASWRYAGGYDRKLADSLTIGGERRNLRGGKLTRHLDSYLMALGSSFQMPWLHEGVGGRAGGKAFESLMNHMRSQIWGTGRLAAFEWAEFTGKVLRLPVQADNGCLWESSGPRESLERIYNEGKPAESQEQLDHWAEMLKHRLYRCGVDLEWWDLETVICDFNVMRKGRYYPGQHLAMIRQEIQNCPLKWQRILQQCLDDAIGAPWSRVQAGVDKGLARCYRNSGKILTPFGRVQ